MPADTPMLDAAAFAFSTRVSLLMLIRRYAAATLSAAEFSRFRHA